MADKHYYVSQQNGNDVNDGLSPATAWATLTKALSVTYTSGYTTYIHVGPGTYREKLSVTNAGSSSSWIIWAGDPDCTFLTNDKPGRVRITGCDVTEAPTSGPVVSIDAGSSPYIEFRDFDIDGTSSSNCAMNSNDQSGNGNTIFSRIRAAGYGGFWGARAIDCIANCATTCYSYGTQLRCVGMGATNVFSSGLRFNCVAMGGTGFRGESTYNERAYNCVALGCYKGFASGASAAPAGVSNCIAIGCGTGFENTRCYDSIAAFCSTGFSGGWTYNCKSLLCSTPSSGATGDAVAAAAMVALDIRNLLNPVVAKSALKDCGWWCCFHSNIGVTGAAVDLTTERLIDITNPTYSPAGESKALAIYIEAKAAAGNVTVELQKNVSSVWTTQKSKTLPVSALTDLKFNRFEWDTGTGSTSIPNYLLAGTWRYRITADVDAQSTTIRTSDGVAISYQGFMLPTLMTQAFDGNPFPCNTLPDVGPWETTSYESDRSVYYTNPPSVKIDGQGKVFYQVPVKGGELVTVKWQVRHHGTVDTLKPQIILSGLGITPQTATHSDLADTWQELSVSATPSASGVLTCELYARDPTPGAYSHFSDPVVS